MPPTSDFVFKYLFGRDVEECRFMLTNLLNGILFEGNKQNCIKELTYLNPFNLKEYKQDKLSVLDIKVKTEKGLRINIEVQLKNNDDYRRRSLYYWSKMYGENIEEGKQFLTLRKAIVINILKYKLIKESERYHTCFRIYEKDDFILLTEDLEIHYLELVKYNYLKNIDEMTDLELWMTFFKLAGTKIGQEILSRLAERSEAIKMAIKKLERMSADERMRYKYLDREMARLDHISQIKYAESKGKKKGMDVTIIALKAFRQGLSIEAVKDLTGIDLKTLRTIERQIRGT